MAFLHAQNILPVAYCPLGRPSASETRGNQAADLKYTQLPDLRLDPGIQAIAKKHGKSEFQVLLRWGIDRGCAVIPKSSCPEHQAQNKDLFGFSLTTEEIAYISGKNQGLRICNKFAFLEGHDIFA